MKKPYFGLICVLLAVSLAGCGPVESIRNLKNNLSNRMSLTGSKQEASAGDVSGEGEQLVEEPTSIPGTVGTEQGETAGTEEIPKMDDTKKEMAPWQEAYLAKLSDFRRDLESGTLEPSLWINEYYIYDLDRNGIPEMLVRIGSCEADYQGCFYTYDESKGVVELGKVWLGHTSVYTYPEGDGLLLHMGHMGYATMEVVSIKNGSLSEEEIFEETLDMGSDAEYTYPQDIFTESRLLDYCAIDKDILIRQYDTVLETAEGVLAPVPSKGDCGIAGMVDDFMAGKGSVMFYSSQIYMSDPGMLNYDQMLLKADGYESPHKCANRVYVDMNRDGYEECVLVLAPDGEYGYSNNWVIFSVQNGTLYGYTMSYMTDCQLMENGVIRYFDGYSSPRTLVFDESGCMEVFVKDNTECAVVM